MNPEIQGLFEAALDLPADARAAFVASQGVDPAVQREVLSLLVHDEIAEPFFARAIKGEASSLVSAMDLREGARIGSYRVISPLGRGGSG